MNRKNRKIKQESHNKLLMWNLKDTMQKRTWHLPRTGKARGTGVTEATTVNAKEEDNKTTSISNSATHISKQ